jgi:dolichol kinase
VGLIAAAWIGGCLIIAGSWRQLSRPLLALVTCTLIAAVLLLSTHVVREWLFGTDSKHAGLVGTHVYWLGAGWNLLIVLAVIALAFAILAIAAGSPGRKERRGALPATGSSR